MYNMRRPRNEKKKINKKNYFNHNTTGATHQPCPHWGSRQIIPFQGLYQSRPLRGRIFPHRQLVLHAFGVITAVCGFNSQLGVDSGDVYMPLTPMFHVHAWGLPYISTLLGVKQVYPGRYEPEFILHLIESEKVTFSHCVPTVLHMIVNNPAARKTDLSRWKLIVGGSALSQITV